MESNSLPPKHSLQTAGFASSIADAHRRNSGDSQDLFVAYVGLVASQDQVLASKCLLALEEALGYQRS